MLLILLLREKSLLAMERFLSLRPATLFVSRENGIGPTERAWDLLKEALRYSQYRAETWRLCGQRKAGKGHLSFNSDDVRQAVDLFEWCFLPWGSDCTGLMIALASSDDHLIRLAEEVLVETQCTDLIVSRYTAAEVADQQFRGAIFNRGLGVRGAGVLDRSAGANALVLTYQSVRSSRKVPADATVVSEIIETDSLGELVKRQWIRANTEAVLLQFARHPYTVMISSSDIGRETFHIALQAFSKLIEDKFCFAISAMQSASWIYLPKTEHLGDEIYINRNPRETAKLLADERVASAPRFALRCFC